MNTDHAPNPNAGARAAGAGHGDERLLTISEAAAIVRAPVATLRYWRHLGTGPRSFRIGRRVLYRHDELVAWINDHHDNDDRHSA